MFSRKAVSLALALIILATPLALAYAAGGMISGTVTDPKGAVIVGATVTVVDPVTTQTFTSITDKQGRFKVEGLVSGSYVITITAKGFSDARRENILVEDNKTQTVDVKMEVAVFEETVTVTASDAKPNTDPIYQQLRQKSNSPDAFSGPYATVSNLVVKRDAATFTLRSGELYFKAPVEGRSTGAVFIGEGEINMTPPTEAEKRHLALFVDKQTLTEDFTQVILHFTDETFEEIKASSSVKMGTNGPQAARARDLYRENESYLRKELRTNVELRTLTDIYSTVKRPGFFVAFINGSQHSKLVYQIDPLGTFLFSPEQVLLADYGQNPNGDFWASFHMADEYRKGTANGSQNRRLYDIKHHEIDATLRGTRLSATDEVTFRANVSGVRVLPFFLLPSLRATNVTDAQGHTLEFVQEHKNEDADFGIIMPEPLVAGNEYKITVQFEGDGAVSDYGGGNFALDSRLNWYPSNGNALFGHRATYTITFRYPKGFTFIGVGAQTMPDAKEDKYMVTKWSSGETELAVAGFNYGKFKKKEVLDKETGYNVEFYANTVVAPDIRNRQLAERMNEMASGKTLEQASGGSASSIGAGGTTGAADMALAQTQTAMRVYNAYFGKLPYTRIAMTQQPYGSFGQSWPTLVYMPYTAFLDETTRVKLIGARYATSTFYTYVAPHEVAHQWWGHIIGWSTYRDQWMSEGFAHFSTSLYVQQVLGQDKFLEFWSEQRDRVLEASPATKGRKPYTVGPMTQGLRLNNSKTGGAYQPIVYSKGPYILHMLRMMMYDRKAKEGFDARFIAMMHDFVKTHYNKDVTTEDFKRAVEKHMTPEMDLAGNGRMDWFFDQWVYGMELPAYKFEYQLGSANGKPTLSGRITQSGVSDNFRMLVPLWVSYDGKLWTRIGSANITGNSSVELNNIPLLKEPKKVAVCALYDVLATSIENVKP